MAPHPVRLQVSVTSHPAGQNNYLRAVTDCGAVPVAGYAPAPDLSCDGLVLCGGLDLSPCLYGQRSMGSHRPDPRRDQAELTLFHTFLQAGRPILGICRGFQLINVALGGTLVQDLPPDLAVLHRGEGRQDQIHPIRTQPYTFLWRLWGPEPLVNSAHHQALDRLGEGLSVTAWAGEGIPEAFVLSGAPVLGVQFHPERMNPAAGTPDGCDIFRWFLTLCR